MNEIMANAFQDELEKIADKAKKHSNRKEYLAPKPPEPSAPEKAALKSIRMGIQESAARQATSAGPTTSTRREVAAGQFARQAHRGTRRTPMRSTDGEAQVNRLTAGMRRRKAEMGGKKGYHATKENFSYAGNKPHGGMSIPLSKTQTYHK